MKTHSSRTSSILSALILLVASGVSGTAQQPIRQEISGPRPAIQQEEQRIPGLASQELTREDLRVAVPRECSGIRPDVQTHDADDKFNPPGNPVTLSPTLTSYLNSLHLTPKGYDDTRVNMVFADSFRLRNCRICYATLEVSARHDRDAWTNDTITVGAAPFTSSPGAILVYAGIWTSPTPNPKLLSFALPTAAMNSYLFSASMPTFLDVIAQDDSDFDYAKLSVWYY